MFDIIESTSGKIVESGFSNGQDAAQRARDLSRATGTSHRVKKADAPPTTGDPQWRQRERLRFERGEYVCVPWHYAAWHLNREESAFKYPDHFVHVSTQNPGKVTYTESEEKGRNDIQAAPIKPGRYLTKFFADVLTTKEIEALALDFAQRYDAIKIKFAHTPDEIESAYLHGPSSCMSYGEDNYESSCHPTRVYGAGDLAVAYYKNSGDRIAARCLCWPDKKRYGRFYGDAMRLRAELVRLGYAEGNFLGAKLLRIRDGGAFVVPYVDYHDYAREIDRKHLEISKSGEIYLQNTNGLSESGPSCDDCGNNYDPDNGGAHVQGHGDWCGRCLDRRAFYCEYSEEYHAICDGVRMADCDLWSQNRYDEHGFTCDKTDECYSLDEAVTLANGDTVCRDWFKDNGATCPECGDKHASESRAAECCDTGEADAPNADHEPRQGRDENPNQSELTLLTAQEVIRRVSAGEGLPESYLITANTKESAS
jgi:hypothetical protein